MELLIPGLIIVALMIYASTRIKRSAAKAFEGETIDASEYSIDKPQGFLNIVDPGDVLLEGYTKEFGTGDAADVRLARYRLVLHGGAAVDEVIKGLGLTQSGEIEVIGERRYITATKRTTAKGINVTETHKLVAAAAGVYDLRLSVMDDAGDDVRSRTDAMLESFRVK
ncbi:MAG: hypothetical protein HS105_00135 [Chloracidobacterium sp.]|nr:hypothetical protein [Chloracidobacterium sp.]MCO5332418.1 hypothetical protein [Pyrinomonadaceae bacterium]